jgi:hypothetical protein
MEHSASKVVVINSNKSTSQSAMDIEIDQDLAKLRQIIKRRQQEMEEEKEDYCETRWVAVDDNYLEYYGFKKPRFCNVHWVNKTLYVIHRPNCKKSIKCHCCGNLCVPQFLCIPCSGEINKSRMGKK